MKIQQYIDEVIEKKNKERSREYKQHCWHASSLGNCQRGMYLQRLGIEPDAPLEVGTLRKFHAGNIFEDWLIGLVKESKEIKSVETQTRVESKLYDVSGRLDLDVNFLNGEREIWECKSQHSKSFWWNIKNGNKPQRHHEYQLWIYLKLMGVEKGRIVYIEKDSLSTQEYSVLLEDKEIASEVINLLTKLNLSWKQKNPLLLDLPPKEDKWKAKFCQYHKKCIDEKYLETLIGKENA